MNEHEQIAHLEKQIVVLRSEITRLRSALSLVGTLTKDACNIYTEDAMKDAGIEWWHSDDGDSSV